MNDKTAMSYQTVLFPYTGGYTSRAM